MLDVTRTPARHAPLVLLSLAAALVHSGVARSATLGFREPWTSTTAGWAGNANPMNPGTGGLGGAGDGFLHISTPSGLLHNLGSVSFEPQYTGNWTTAGITQVRLWLNDVGVDDPLEMHFGIGTDVNFWQYNPGFLPPNSQWGQFTVDLSSSANWTRIIGTSGTYAAALQGADRILVRHDKPPFVMTPDAIDADVGIDGLLLTNGVAGVGPDANVAHPLLLAPPVPNPSRGPVALSLEVYDQGPVRLEIVDAAGRLVRRARLPGGQPGPRIWTWDGRDESGRPVPAGYYGVRAAGDSGGMSRPLIRVR